MKSVEKGGGRGWMSGAMVMENCLPVIQWTTPISHIWHVFRLLDVPMYSRSNIKVEW